MNGLELVSKLENKNIRVVFTTAHRQYAIEALRLGAFDYLLKPIDIADLRRVVNNMELVSPDISAQYQLAIKGRMEHMGAQFSSRPISISFQGGIEFVFPIEIVYCESDVNYTHVYLNSGRKIIVSKTLKAFGDELQEDLFIRCHKSFIVNRMYVSKYLRLEQHYLQLLNDARIPVSSRKREYTQDALQGRTMD
jgi:two-component system LytT family response regulator